MVTRAYPNYRDSGVEWLGDVPEHWAVRPLKTVLARNDGGVWGNDPDDDDLSGTIVLRSTEQTIDGGWSISEPARRQLSLQEKASALLKAGDLVVTKSSGSEFHIGKASLVTGQVASLDACFSNFMQRLRCLPVFEPRLAWYLLNSPVGRQQLVFHSNTTTGLANLNGTILGEAMTPVPPRDEQRAIAAFLDRETERIDALVEKKRLLIERLEEYRTALITRTVTRGLPPEAARAAGLDPLPRLKASGVEWLGDVPEHWSVQRLGYLASKFGSGITPRGGATIYEEAGVPFIRSQNIHFDGLRMQDVARITPKMHSEMSASHVRPDDVLLNITGASIGRVCSVPDDFAEGNVNQHVCIIRVNRGHLLPDLLAAYLSTPAMQREIQLEQSGASREGLTLQSIREFRVVVPPISEQVAIVKYLGRTSANVRVAVDSTRRQLERLREYRTALISAAVTGKIDVRKQMAAEETDADGAPSRLT